MPDPITVWHGEHARFSRLLDLLEAQVAVFQAGEQPDYQLMRDIVSYLRLYGDHVHHPREDVAFARLVERDPDMRLVINRLLQEHRVLATAGEELMRCLEDIEVDAVIERQALEAAAAAYLVYYRHHLATEESQVVPRAAQLLTPHDWSTVTAAVPDAPDPLFGTDPAAGFAELRRQIASGAPKP